MRYFNFRPFQKGAILILEVILIFLFIYLVYYTILLIQHGWNTLTSLLEHHETNLNFTSMKYDDLNLLHLIRNDYLSAPSDSSVKRNLAKKVWKGPVTSAVLKLLHNKSNGFFIEAGANDGEFLSNSLPLEVIHGWSGLLVEADPAPLQRLLSKNRKSWVAKCCLSPFNNSVEIKMVTHKKWNGIGNIPNLFKGIVKKGDFSEPFAVQCFPLYSLLLAIGQTSVDYMSLDVEGAEFEILKTIPFDKISIKVISVEVNSKIKEIINFLKKKGYKRSKRIVEPFVNDLIFIHSNALKP